MQIKCQMYTKIIDQKKRLNYFRSCVVLFKANKIGLKHLTDDIVFDCVKYAEAFIIIFFTSLK